MSDKPATQDDVRAVLGLVFICTVLAFFAHCDAHDAKQAVQRIEQKVEQCK